MHADRAREGNPAPGEWAVLWRCKPRRSRARLAPAAFAGLLSVMVSLPLPAQHTFVVATHGNDSHPGTADRPLRTLGAALRQAGYGDTILVGPGAYREQVILSRQSAPRLESTRRQASPGRRLTLKAAAPELRPWLKGSDLLPFGTFQPVREAPRFDTNGHVTGFAPLPGGAHAYRVRLPGLSGRPPQQVFVSRGGVTIPLQQAGRAAPVVAALASRPFWTTSRLALDEDSFAFARDHLYLRLKTPLSASDAVEVSTRAQIWNARSYPHVWLEGIGFEHSNASAVREQNAVQLGEHSVITNCIVQWTDLDGLGLPSHAVAAGCWLHQNGRLGGVSLDHALFTNCLVTGNNCRQFLTDHAGGIKISSKATDMSGTTIARCEFAANHGPAIWIDSCVAAFEPMGVKNNYIHDNLPVARRGHPCGGQQAVGLMLEVSSNILVFNNLIVNNPGSGIFVSGSSGCQLYHNTVVTPRLADFPGVCAGHKGFVPLLLLTRVAQCATNAAAGGFMLLGGLERNTLLNNLFVSASDPATGLSPVAVMTPNGCPRTPTDCACVKVGRGVQPSRRGHHGASSGNRLDYNIYFSGSPDSPRGFCLLDDAQHPSRRPALCPNALVPFAQWRWPNPAAPDGNDLMSCEADPGFLPPSGVPAGSSGPWLVPPGPVPDAGAPLARRSSVAAAHYLVAPSSPARASGALMPHVTDPDFASDIRGVPRRVAGQTRPDRGAFSVASGHTGGVRH